ncbi:MAG: sulfopyruvate decarboxylase [Nitrospinota bacterium]
MNVNSPHRPNEALAALKTAGFRVAVSVPDSWLGGIMAEIDGDPDMTLIRATHEEEALSISCGARLGGARTVLLIQNVGILTMGAGMVSLAQRYQFPILILASYRGSAQDPTFYHIPKGRVTEPALQALGLRYAVAYPAAPIGPQVERAAAYAEESSAPFVLLLSREDIRW